MKTLILTLFVFLVCSCGTNRILVQNYYYVEPFEEQEIQLSLLPDLTFKLQDSIGCNRFIYTGVYRKGNTGERDYFLFDIAMSDTGVLNPYKKFPISKMDTVWVLNSERIFIHNKPFKINKYSLNLQKVRFKKICDYYIDLMGKRAFIETFGDGKSIRSTKKRLLSCQLPDIKLR